MSQKKTTALRPVRKHEWRQTYAYYKIAGRVSVIFGIIQGCMMFYMLGICGSLELDTIPFKAALVRMAISIAVLLVSIYVTDKASVIKHRALRHAERLLRQQERYDAYVRENNVALRRY